MALRNHPRAASAALIAEAARMGVTEARAPFNPQVSGAFTGVAAEHGSTLAAGTMQTSSLYSRIAAGVTVSQLITDFGRTGNLVASAKSAGGGAGAERGECARRPFGSSSIRLIMRPSPPIRPEGGAGRFRQPACCCCGRCGRWRRAR